ncbi:hypothetical protein BLNAU_10947 [Blattamonas nauphoetae]|uniref:Uncharacterized protein n=1 Tax=Blattamonas nauphoetae TaxID=2049346 RepID=A0ABQ9XSY5_9EUKA|nr:hypothetical protein BLNAU_10947 [Blattamonas nauphoetae]
MKTNVPSIDYLTLEVPLLHDTRSYYHDMIRMFLAFGYVPGISLFGSPYDWRQCLAADSILIHESSPDTNPTSIPCVWESEYQGQSNLIIGAARKDGDEQRRRRLCVITIHSNRVYNLYKCGESFHVENGHATIPPSFSPSFLQNRANPAFWAFSDANLDGRDLQASERDLTNPIFPPFPTTQMMSPNHPPPQPRRSLHVFPDESKNAFYLFATQKQDPPQKGTHTHDFKRVALLPFVERKDAGESSLKSRILAGVFDVLSTTEYRLRRENDKKARDRFQESWQKALERSDELKFNQDDDEFDLMRFGRDDRREG